MSSPARTGLARRPTVRTAVRAAACRPASRRDPGCAVRPMSATGAPASPRHQHDGSLWAGQQPLRRRVDPGDAVRGGQIGHHDGERLVAAALSVSQLGDRELVPGVAGQVVAADSFDCEDTAVAQQPSGVRQRRFTLDDVASAGPVAQCRPAVRAADRLGVEPAVGRIVVFARAVRTHREWRPSWCWRGRRAARR